MTTFQKNLLRAACLAAVFYLIADAFVFHGPVHRWLRSFHSKEVVARVAGQPISRSQLDRALAERLWLAGKSPASQTAADRRAALDELIDHELLRLQVKEIASQLPVSDGEINERLRRFSSRFESKGVLETAMKSQGIAGEKNFRTRLASQIQQEKYISRRIDPFIRVTDQEARQWFDKNQQSISLPERVEARHIFIPTLDHPSEEARQKLAEALAALTEKKKDFTTLARELSEDPANKDRGGALGWMTRERLPADFAAAVFSLALNQPQLIRTTLGWHLVEVTARKAAEPRTFEQVKPEILAALEAVKRRQATADFRQALRKEAASKIEISQDVLAE